MAQTRRRPKPAHKFSRPPYLEKLEGRDLPSFITPPSYSIDGKAEAIAVGKFNHDGLPDLAVVGGGRLTILAGTIDGDFQTLVMYSQAGRHVIAADFTGDNVLDLATAKEWGTGTVYVLVGNGNGTFKPPVSYTGNAPGILAAGDFDGDGDVDLAAADYDYFGPNGKVGILINSGTGAFSSGGTYSTGTNPHDITTGDFDNDGDLDLAVTGHYYVNDLQDTIVKVLLGNGDGQFHFGATYNDARPVALTTGDFNADGRLDLAVANHDGVGSNNDKNGVSVWLGNGNGTFKFKKAYDIASYPISIATGDLDGNGQLDLVIVSSLASNVSVLHGTGGGNFVAATGYGLAEEDGSDVVVEDLDNDGDLDMAGACGRAITVLRNNGSGNFQPAVANLVTGGALNVTSADFNADGTPDIAVSGGPGYPSNKVIVIPVQANGSFGAAVSYTVGTGPEGFVAADFNNDGFPDLATSNSSNNISVLMNKGDGTFFPTQTFAAGVSPRSIGAADFTGDGKLDLIVTNHTDAATLRLLRGTGTGRFRAPQSFDAGPWAGVLTIADFDEDGDQDVAAACGLWGCNTMRIILSDGPSSFASPITYVIAPHVNDVEPADLNSDGVIDLAVHASGMFSLLGNGDGTFSIVSNPDPGAGGVEVADFNRDGIMDLALTHHLASLCVTLGNGDGTFQTPTYFATGNGEGAAVAIDFNGDDWPDLLMAQEYGEGVAVAINAADWAPAPIGHGRRQSRPATAMHFTPINERYLVGLPRSGSIAQPRVAQRTLGERNDHTTNLKGLDRSHSMQPFQGKSMLTTDEPGCASRPWAEIRIPFGEMDAWWMEV